MHLLRTALLATLIHLIGPLSAGGAGEPETVLAAYYQARGGLEKLRGLESMRADGSVTLEAATVVFTLYVKQGKSRLDLHMGGLHVAQVFDGRDSWQVNPTYGTLTPQPLTGTEKNQLIEFTDLAGPLVDWQQKGHSLSYRGIKEIDGKPAHALHLDTELSAPRIYYLDSQTHLPVFYLEESPNGSIPNHITAYLKEAGITFVARILVGEEEGCTHSIHNQQNVCGFKRNMVITSLAVNPKLDDQLFQKEDVVARMAESP